MSASSRGSERERKVAERLRADGWFVVRAAGSFGLADLVALRADRKIGCGVEAMLIEVKSTQRNPWNDFGPAQRRALAEAAVQSGARAVLAWWPIRGKLEMICSEDWPPS